MLRACAITCVHGIFACCQGREVRVCATLSAPPLVSFLRVVNGEGEGGGEGGEGDEPALEEFHCVPGLQQASVVDEDDLPEGVTPWDVKRPVRKLVGGLASSPSSLHLSQQATGRATLASRVLVRPCILYAILSHT